jgi:thiamine pyrophosphate-dependent acetolactate synthase large subunit-like protein
MLGIRYPTEVNLTGDSAQTLRALIPLLRRKEDRSWRESIEKDIGDWWKVLEARAMNDADPINPQRVFHELSPRLVVLVLNNRDLNLVTWEQRTTSRAQKNITAATSR